MRPGGISVSRSSSRPLLTWWRQRGSLDHKENGKVLKGAWEELRDCKVKLFSALVHGEGVIIGLAGRPEPEPARPLSPSVARGLQQHLGLTGAEMEGLS